MAGANLTTFSDLLKEVYAPGVNSQINADDVLLSEIESSSSGVQMGEHGGKYTVIGLKLGRNTSAGPRGEGATLQDPGQTRVGRATLDLTYQYAVGSVTGPSQAKTKADAKAYARILTAEIDGVREGMTHSIGRQVWGHNHGAFATISSLNATTGPWTLTVDTRAVNADWLEETTLLQLVTVSGGVATVQDSGAVLQIDSVDTANSTIDVSQVSGTSTPAIGEQIVVEGTANLCLQGLEQMISDTTSTFQGIDRSTERRWRASRLDASSGAFSFDMYQKLRNEVNTRSGKYPDLVITSYGIERAAFNDLQDQIRYTKAKDLEFGEGVVLPGPGNPKLKASNQCKKGSLFAIHKDSLRVYADGDYDFLQQGNSNLLMFGRKDLVEFVLKRYMQIGAIQLNSHGEIFDIADSSAF